VNSFKNKILFRCDAADIPEIGTGHLYRCLTIANFKKTFMRIYDNKIYKKKINAIQHKIINTNKLKKTMTLIYNLYEKSES
jgi:spore coat polysaccharide biosynthesis predicted glycosyltransferase SpsG